MGPVKQRKCVCQQPTPTTKIASTSRLLTLTNFRTKIHVMKSIMIKNPVMPMIRQVEDVSGVYVLQYQAHVIPLKLQIIYPQEFSIAKNKGGTIIFFKKPTNLMTHKNFTFLF